MRLEVCRSLEEWCLLRSLSCDLSLCSRLELFLSRSLSLSLSLARSLSLSLSLSLCLSLSFLSCFSRLCLLSSLCPFSFLASNCFSRYAYLQRILHWHACLPMLPSHLHTAAEHDTAAASRVKPLNLHWLLCNLAAAIL